MIKLLNVKAFVVSASLLGAMLFCGASGVAAQGLPSIVVDVPFDFIVNGKTLPSGKYRVHRTFVDSDSVLYINRVGSDEGTSFTTNAAMSLSSPNKTALIFHHYGSEHYLAEIWTGANNIGYRLPVSKSEQLAARIGRAGQPTAPSNGRDGRPNSKGDSTGQSGKSAAPSKSS